MAPKKTTALAVKPKNTAIAPMEDWEIQAQAEAKDERAKEVLGMPRISHKGGVIKIDKEPVKGGMLPHVIVDYIMTKAYYEGEYDPDGPVRTPVCYAYGREEKAMNPHPEAPDKQHDTCVGCPHNKFGTAEKGRGKRCKDERKIAALVACQDPSEVAKGEVRTYTVPPGSLKNWGNYLASLTDVTPTGNVRFVLTELSTAPGDRGAHVLKFRAVEKLDREFAQAVLARKPGLEAQMFAPWPQIGEEEQEQKPRKRVKGQ